MFPFNWNGDDYNEETKKTFRKRLKRKAKMYGLITNTKFNKNDNKNKECLQQVIIMEKTNKISVDKKHSV